MTVATKFWSWILNPLQSLKQEEVLHISRSNGQPDEQKDEDKFSDDDSESDSEEERIVYNYDQQERYDNMVDPIMVREYLKKVIGDATAKIEYGTHVDAVRYLNH